MAEWGLRCRFFHPFEGDSVFDNLLQKYVGDDVLIPFEMEDRREKFPLAFKELERYMEKYISLKGWKIDPGYEDDDNFGD